VIGVVEGRDLDTRPLDGLAGRGQSRRVVGGVSRNARRVRSIGHSNTRGRPIAQGRSGRAWRCLLDRHSIAIRPSCAYRVPVATNSSSWFATCLQSRFRSLDMTHSVRALRSLVCQFRLTHTRRRTCSSLRCQARAGRSLSSFLRTSRIKRPFGST